MKDPYASEEETRALIQPDTRMPEQKEAAKLADENWLNEQGMEAPPQRDWVGLTEEEIDQGLLRSDYAMQTAHAWRAGVVYAMTKLKEKNNG